MCVCSALIVALIVLCAVCCGSCVCCVHRKQRVGNKKSLEMLTPGAG